MLELQSVNPASITEVKLTIASYFATLNQGQFEATAALFSPQGRLCPPYQSPIIGREAIVAYLREEASEIQLIPLAEKPCISSNGQIQVDVRGQVQIAGFKLNAVWTFWLNSDGKIDQVQIELLATWEELLQVRW